jgi:hypothetical protein
LKNLGIQEWWHQSTQSISLTPRLKLHPKFEWERFVTAIKIDRIPLFDVRRWTFISFFFDLAGRSFGRRLG